MSDPASEKLEIIRTVEGSHRPAKQALDMLGIPRTTFYRWYDRYVEGGFDALADRSPRPKSVWNRIPQARWDDLIEFALEHEALTPRELAVKYTDEKRYFISESSAYRFLKEADLIAAPDGVVIKAARAFTDKMPSKRCGRPTSPPSKSLAGADFISARSWMITAATALAGSSARTCGPRT